jgi:hypothetical protein
LTLVVLCAGALNACGGDPAPLCADDGDPAGPACRTALATGTEFEALSVPLGAHPNPERGTKYMAPVEASKELLPPLFQNLNRFEVHLVFLRQVFPELFGELDPQAYQALILARGTRRYYAGNLLRFQHPTEGELYGFTVWTLSQAEELLELEEVRALYQTLAEVFRAGPLRYTFERSDLMARQKAEGWADPGFPIYFP